jgi:glycosyltransferase involved in cell wall biosynthesis
LIRQKKLQAEQLPKGKEDNGLRILHIWDTAGVSGTLAKYQRLRGLHVDVITRPNFDPMDINKFYGDYVIPSNGKDFLLYSIMISRHYDIIHVHSLPSYVQKIKVIHPKKKVLLHIHGKDDCEKANKTLYNLADVVITATPDLQEHLKDKDKIFYLPNMVDTDHFKPYSSNRRKGAITFSIRYLDMDKTRSYLEQRGYACNFDVIDREKTTIPYKDMPAFLSQFEEYIDVKFFQGDILKASSKTGLEALACGLRVINWQGKRLTELPYHHRPEYVMRECMRCYQQI